MHQVSFVKIISALKVVKQNQTVQMIWIARTTSAKIHAQMLSAVKMLFVDQRITEHSVSVPTVSLVNQQWNAVNLNVNKMKTVIWISNALLELARILVWNVAFVEIVLNVAWKIDNPFAHVSLAMLAIPKFNVLNQELSHVSQTLVEKTATVWTQREVPSANVKLDALVIQCEDALVTISRRVHARRRNAVSTQFAAWIVAEIQHATVHHFTLTETLTPNVTHITR